MSTERLTLRNKTVYFSMRYKLRVLLLLGAFIGLFRCSKEKELQVSLLGSRGKYISFVRWGHLKTLRVQYGILDREVGELKKLRGKRIMIRGKELDPLTFAVYEIRRDKRVIYKKKGKIEPIPVVEPFEATGEYYIVQFGESGEANFQPSDGYVALPTTVDYEEFIMRKNMPIMLVGDVDYKDNRFWLVIKNGRILLDISAESKFSSEREKDRQDFLLLQLATTQTIKEEKIKIPSHLMKVYGVVMETADREEYTKTKILGIMRVYKLKPY